MQLVPKSATLHDPCFVIKMFDPVDCFKDQKIRRSEDQKIRRSEDQNTMRQGETGRERRTMRRKETLDVTMYDVF